MRIKSAMFVIIIILFILSIITFQKNYIQYSGVYLTGNSTITAKNKIAVSRGTMERLASKPQETQMYSEQQQNKSVPVESDGKEGIVIATFNIRHGVDLHDRERLDEIIREIKDSGAQVIGLQEVDRYVPRSEFKDQIKEIAQSLSLHYSFGESINILGVRYGNAVLSQYPILHEANLSLPTESLEGRTLLKADIGIGGDVFHFFVTHLGLSRKEREEQILFMNKEIEKQPEKVILLGDFNAQPTYPEMKRLSPALQDIAILQKKQQDNTYAFYSSKPDVRIDYIFVSKDINTVGYWIHPTNVSDHEMVVAKIKTKTPPKEGIYKETTNNKY